MKSAYNFQEYNMIQDRKIKYKLYGIILIILIIAINIILYKIPLKIYQKEILIKDNNNYYLIVDSKNIINIETNNAFFINQKKYKYDILKIDNDYTNINGIIYQTVYINPHNYKSNTIINDCYFLKSNKTIFEYLMEEISGGK